MKASAVRKTRSMIEEGILRYLENKKSAVTFKELYAALDQFSEQGIRNRVYMMIEEGIIERTKPLVVEYKRIVVRFKLK